MNYKDGDIVVITYNVRSGFFGRLAKVASLSVNIDRECYYVELLDDESVECFWEGYLRKATKLERAVK